MKKNLKIVLIVSFAIVSVFFLIFFVQRVIQNKQLADKNSSVRIVSKTEKPVFELVKNSQKTGQLSAVLPKKTTVDDIKKALEELPEGNNISFNSSSGKGVSTVMTFKKENGKIKLIYLNEEKLNPKNNEQSKNKGSFLNNFVEVSKAEELSTVSLGDLTDAQLGSLLKQLVTLIQQNKSLVTLVSNQNLIKQNSLLGFSDTVANCMETGGSWFRFTNECVFGKKQCGESGTTDCSLFGLNAFDGCQCPVGSCIDPSGKCVEEETPVDLLGPCFDKDVCNVFGGYWNEKTAQTAGACPCENKYSSGETGSSSVSYKKTCEESGGKWKMPVNRFKPRFFPKGKGGCSCDCNTCSCWDEKGIYQKEETEVQKMLNELSISLDGCDEGWNFMSDSVTETGNFNLDYFFNFKHPWRKNWGRQPYCACPFGQIVDQKGKCSVPMVDPEINNCVNSGGNWTNLSGGCCPKEKQKCGSESLICDCTAEDLTRFEMGCQCQAGSCVGGNGQCVPGNSTTNNTTDPKCKVGQFYFSWSKGGKNKCYSGEEIKNNCTSSGGNWKNIGYQPLGQETSKVFGTASCSTNESPVFKQETCERGNNGGISCIQSVSDSQVCECKDKGLNGVKVCLDSEGRCVTRGVVPQSYETSCEDSGGIWISKNSKNYNNGGIQDTSYCSCPKGTSLLDQRCQDLGLFSYKKNTCESSGGKWLEAVDAPQYSFCVCAGDPEAGKDFRSRTKYPLSCYEFEDKKSACVRTGGAWEDRSYAAYVYNIDRCYCPSGKNLKKETGECL